MNTIEPVEQHNVGDRAGYVLDRITANGGAETFRLFTERTTPSGAIEQDYYESDSIELIRAVLGVAQKMLLRGQRPELTSIAADFKRRDRTLATATRRTYRRANGGGLILGDTPPDEMPQLG